MCRYLNLMCNQLHSLPEELCELRYLHRLGLKANQLQQLPQGLGCLTSLVELFLTDNRSATLTVPGLPQSDKSKSTLPLGPGSASGPVQMIPAPRQDIGRFVS